MDRSDVIELVTTTRQQDDYGVWRATDIKRQVFCKVESVSRAEFFEGGRNGLKPEFRMIIFAGDYAGEQTVIYNGVPYAVYRTFLGKNDNLELYVEKKTGVVYTEAENGGS